MINSTRLNCVSNFERDKEPFVRRMFTIRRTKDDAVAAKIGSKTAHAS